MRRGPGSGQAGSLSPGAALAALLSCSEVDVDECKDVSQSYGVQSMPTFVLIRGGKVIAAAVHEHVENAGVHSGDATLMLPPQTLSDADVKEVSAISHKMAEALQITGPFNMQLIAKDGKIKVIECNLRASRSFPFSSKCLGVNFIETATRAMCSETHIEPMARTVPDKDFVGVKAPMFSFQRLKGADPSLGVEMASTGEVACLGADVYEAYLRALEGSCVKVPTQADASRPRSSSSCSSASPCLPPDLGLMNTSSGVRPSSLSMAAGSKRQLLERRSE